MILCPSAINLSIVGSTQDVNWGNDITIYQKESVTIGTSSGSYLDYLWSTGDGKNDVYKPFDEGWEGIHGHSISVFNRWGEKVWESNDFPSG